MKRSLGVILFLLLFIGGCGSSSSESSDDKLQIYTTVYPLQFFIQEIGGEFIESETVYPAGVDAHTYEPTAKIMTKLAEADAFIYIHPEYEAFAAQAEKALKNQEVKIFSIHSREELFDNETHANEEDGHNHGEFDPHIWLDPIRAKELVEVLKEELVTLDPEHKDFFEERTEKLKGELDQIHQEFVDLLSTKQELKILVSHAGYGYWESRYGIEMIAVQGVSTSDEPSQKELEQIINKAQKNDMEYLIFEQNIQSNVSDILQSELGLKALTIHNLEVLTEQDHKDEEDYFSIMRKNLKVLQKALK
ncbi:zinc ABC transporter substrate-binding protein [Bacillaceae bacterium S4-13-56]